VVAFTTEHPVTPVAQTENGKRFWWMPHHVRRERIQAALAAFEAEMFAESVESPLQRRVESAMKDAARFARDGAFQAAWGSLAAARRLELLTLKREALETRAVVLAREASQKLRSWRKESAASLLGESYAKLGLELESAVKQFRDALGGATEPKTDASPRRSQSRYGHFSDVDLQVRCWLVAHLLDGASDNTYFKQELRAEAVRRLLSLLVLLTIVAILALTPVSPFPVPPSKANSVALLPYIALLGALGACLSGIRSLVAPATDAIPEVVLSSFATAIRPAVGVAAALVIFLAQAGGVINLANGSVPAVLTLAFVAGFSEALLLRVVGSIDKTSSKG
jgi:hypothetical protein